MQNSRRGCTRFPVRMVGTVWGPAVWFRGELSAKSLSWVSAFGALTTTGGTSIQRYKLVAWQDF